MLYSLVAHELLTKLYGLEEIAYCYIPTTILKYFITAGFFWMFVEGVYLLISVAFSFHAKRIQFWMCAVVGWVIPLVLIAVTAIAKANGDRMEECWNEQHYLDYIFIGPVLCILLLNVFFLVIIMYVVVTKLQVTVPAEATRYRKAIKALFILCPLLGVNYVFILVQPSHPLWARLVFSYYFTVMTSIQGSLVAILFCFQYNDVWQTIKKSSQKWTRAMGINGSISQKIIRRSLRMDTQSSTIIDPEQSSAGWQSRRSVAVDAKALNGVKSRNRNSSKRSTNVIIMRDDGESSLAKGGRKTTAPAKLNHDCIERPPIQREAAKRDKQRYSLPGDSELQPSLSTPLPRTARTNASSKSNREQQKGRRAPSNYRPVRARSRHAYDSERTSAFS